MSNTITVEPEEGVSAKVLTLPAFRRWEHIYFKIISPNQEIRVSTYEADTCTGVQEQISYHAVCDDSLEITEEEFNSALNSTLQKINEAVKH